MHLLCKWKKKIYFSFYWGMRIKKTIKKTQNTEARFLTNTPKAAYSSNALTSTQQRMNSGRNSEKQVTATNPRVKGPDTSLGNRYLAVASAFFNAISSVKHNPWRTKNHVILNVGPNLPM